MCGGRWITIEQGFVCPETFIYTNTNIKSVLLCWPAGDEREESDDEHLSDDESDDDDNEIPYNPKNLPLGWDGKVRNITFCIKSCDSHIDVKYKQGYHTKSQYFSL